MIQEFSDKTKMLMQLLFSRLSEKDRRQYAALEALKLGRGGTTYVSEVLAVNRNTVIQVLKSLRLKQRLSRQAGSEELVEGEKKRQKILR